MLQYGLSFRTQLGFGVPAVGGGPGHVKSVLPRGGGGMVRIAGEIEEPVLDRAAEAAAAAAAAALPLRGSGKRDWWTAPAEGAVGSRAFDRGLRADSLMAEERRLDRERRIAEAARRKRGESVRSDASLGSASRPAWNDNAQPALPTFGAPALSRAPDSAAVAAATAANAVRGGVGAVAQLSANRRAGRDEPGKTAKGKSSKPGKRRLAPEPKPRAVPLWAPRNPVAKVGASAGVKATANSGPAESASAQAPGEDPYVRIFKSGAAVPAFSTVVLGGAAGGASPASSSGRSSRSSGSSAGATLARAGAREDVALQMLPADVVAAVKREARSYFSRVELLVGARMLETSAALEAADAAKAAAEAERKSHQLAALTSGLDRLRALEDNIIVKWAHLDPTHRAPVQVPPPASPAVHMAPPPPPPPLLSTVEPVLAASSSSSSSRPAPLSGVSPRLARGAASDAGALSASKSSPPRRTRKAGGGQVSEAERASILDGRREFRRHRALADAALSGTGTTQSQIITSLADIMFEQLLQQVSSDVLSSCDSVAETIFLAV
jgi:hypothetical protein